MDGFNLWGAQPDMPFKLIYIGFCLLLGAMFITGLIFVPRPARKPLIATVTFIAGLYFSLEFFLPEKAVALRLLESEVFHERMLAFVFGWYFKPLAASGLDLDQNFITPSVFGLITAWQVIAGFTFALGMLNLIHIHGRNVLRVGRNWFFSLFFFVGLFFMASVGFLSTYGRWAETEQAADWFRVATQGMFFSLDAAMFSLIAFFIISAAYRAFRIRSIEATIMMVAAFLVMLGQVPVGIVMTSWLPTEGFLYNLRLENISYWILTQPNAAAQRGINFGLAVGALAMGLRIWLSLERGSYFDKDL